jgi:hypothetical protein
MPPCDAKTPQLTTLTTEGDMSEHSCRACRQIPGMAGDKVNQEAMKQVIKKHTSPLARKIAKMLKDNKPPRKAD